VEQTSFRAWTLQWLAGGFLTGLLVAAVMPDSWSNLAFVPWYVSWFVLPSWILALVTCGVFHVDCMSNAANVDLVHGIWMLAVATVLAIYSLILGLMVRRFRSRNNLTK
jgi:Na+/H+-dicarboxylate symporter